VVDLDLNTLFKLGGFPCFPLDDDGFPYPGPIIKYYREKQRFIDRDGKEKPWTQEELGKHLGIKEWSVRAMETKNEYLDSISRRRMVANLLGIPPMLLLPTSITDLKEFLMHYQEQGTSRLVVPNASIVLYQDVVSLYETLHYTGTAQHALPTMEQWISRVKADTIRSSGPQLAQLQTNLWKFHILIARVYCDQCNYSAADKHLNHATSIATTNEQKSVTLLREGSTKSAQQNYLSANAQLQGAMKYVKLASPQLKASVTAEAVLMQSYVGQGSANNIQNQFDNIRLMLEQDGIDTYHMHYDIGKTYLVEADALLSCDPGRAITILDDAEDLIPSDQKRRLAYLNIIRADAYIRLNKLDYATTYLTEALNESLDVSSAYNVSYITRLYNKLAESKHKNSAAVTNLGTALRTRQHTA
jgi:tetratricopeptide (TPR) repeat protein